MLLLDSTGLATAVKTASFMVEGKSQVAGAGYSRLLYPLHSYPQGRTCFGGSTAGSAYFLRCTLGSTLRNATIGGELLADAGFDALSLGEPLALKGVKEHIPGGRNSMPPLTDCKSWGVSGARKICFF